MRIPPVLVVSLLVHLAAIGLLSALRPSPYPDTAESVMAVEISIEPEPGSDRPDPSRARSAEIAAMPFLSPSPDATATAPSSAWTGDVHLPPQPFFEPDKRAPGLDTLGKMLDCRTVQGTGPRASRRPLPTHHPCADADLPLWAPTTKFQTSESEPGRSGMPTGDGYRIFETIRPLFDESLFPASVPPANRAFKEWLMGLFH